jgi:hypothetical protein
LRRPGGWRLIDGTGASYDLKATDLREARAEAVEQHGMPDGGVGIPKCSDFGLFRPMGKGTFIVSYYNGDNDSIEETGLEAAAWGAAVKEAAALFYLEPDAFEEIVKDDKVRDAATTPPPRPTSSPKPRRPPSPRPSPPLTPPPTPTPPTPRPRSCPPWPPSSRATTATTASAATAWTSR